MKEHQRHIQKSVRLFTIGKPSPNVKHLWVCLHGYGQLADWFGKRFERWASKERLFLFPEGPHRFYLHGTAGRVGASWMTKEDRLNDIEDQFNYLEELTVAQLHNLPKAINIHVLGFSQGVATALRWLDRSTLPISSLICWAGTFPPDIDYKLNASKFQNINLHACFGDTDEFISTEKAKELVSQLQSQEININAHYYEGGHRLKLNLLDELIADCEA
jgi:predicted esterase